MIYYFLQGEKMPHARSHRCFNCAESRLAGHYRTLKVYRTLNEDRLPEEVREFYSRARNQVCNEAKWCTHKDDMEGTISHQLHVAEVSASIARQMQVDKDVFDRIKIAGWLHDCGKPSMDPDVLFKHGIFDEDEKRLIGKHPEAGAQIILDRLGQEWTDIAEIVLQHHECEDGSGYPFGLKGDQIRLEAKIIAVADIHCALIERRCYKTSFSVRDAASFILTHKIKHHPDVISAYLHVIEPHFHVHRKTLTF